MLYFGEGRKKGRKGGKEEILQYPLYTKGSFKKQTSSGHGNVSNTP
jgi:hypothetical protein